MAIRARVAEAKKEAAERPDRPKKPLEGKTD